MAVPIPVSTVEPLSVTQNGTYTPPTGVDGYAPVTVNVSTSAEPKDVNFIDYDGTIRYSYTKDEFLALTAMPENPTHAGLVSQGWNWSLADAQEYVAENGMLVVGQMYATESGDTEIDVELRSSFLSPYLSVSAKGQVTVYWGDGASTVVTGTSMYTPKYVQHIYSEAGRYTIRLHLDSGTQSICNSDTNFILSANSSTANENRPYSHSVRAIRVGTDITAIQGCAFSDCGNLEYVTLHDMVSVVNERAFADCYNIKGVTIPSNCSTLGARTFYYCVSLRFVSTTKGPSAGDYFSNCVSLEAANVIGGSIGNNAFSSCYTLRRLSIPSSVTSIGSSVFFNAYCLNEIHFHAETPPTLSGAFFNANTAPRAVVIYVPQGSLSAYTSASNYPSSSTYTYVEE